jgi:LmbE family N-acetylglucosaminyl deacetylase
LEARTEQSSARARILAVLAHPDDESFGMGGTLALYAGRGHDVYLLCATRGEAGTVDPEYLRDFESIAKLREAELRCAAEKLGLRRVDFLGYRDSGMPDTPENKHPDAQVAHSIDEVAGRVVRRIREWKPELVLTFDPIGGYRHPDHIHIQRATTLAFERAGDAEFHPESGAPFEPRALYYHVFPHRFLRLVTRLMPVVGANPRKWGRNKDIDLVSLTEYEFPIHARIDTKAVQQKKAAAGACHASQEGIQMRRGLIGVVTRFLGEHEDYMRAYPPPSDRRVAKDLFEGI